MADARIYTPFQHTVKPQGCEHVICFANMELWMDKLPDAMDVGGILWWRGADSVAATDACDNDPSD